MTPWNDGATAKIGFVLQKAGLGAIAKIIGLASRADRFQEMLNLSWPKLALGVE
jgi:hypothetical protein